MKNHPALYNDKQREQFERHIKENWIEEGEKIEYFIESSLDPKHVRVDVCVTRDAIITEGIGAREINSPEPDYHRIEIVMFKSPELTDEQKFIACVELKRFGEYPFEHDTWFGAGHIVDASPEFKKAFGYDRFFFQEFAEGPILDEIGEIRMLIAVPIYKEERDWMIGNENGNRRFFDAFMDSVDTNDDRLFNIDYKRPVFIPEE